MKSEIFWKNPGYRTYSKLKRDIECEYLIVGGGITGVSLAYFLTKLGAKNIVLIEKNIVGSGATGRSAGILTLKSELDLTQLIEKFGRKKALIYWKGNHEGLDIIRKIIKEEKLNCDFEPQHTILGGLFNGDYKWISREYKNEKKIEKRSKLLDNKNIKSYINTSLFKNAILSFDHGISVNPLKHVQNLSKVVEKYGVSIFENTKLLLVKKNTAITPKAKIKFRKIIIATDSYLDNKKVKNNKSTLIVTERLTDKQLKETNLQEKKLVWDSEDIYHYLKITRDNRILIGYGDRIVNKKHKKLHPHYSHLKELRIFLKRLFPYLNIKIEYAWSGVFGKNSDLIPYIKINNNKITVAGSGSQVVCVMAAKYISNKIFNKRHSLDYFFRK